MDFASSSSASAAFVSSVPTVVDPSGKTLSPIEVLSTQWADMRVQIGSDAFEILAVESTVDSGHAAVVVQYNVNPVPTGAVQPQFFVSTLLPWISIRIEGTVNHIRQHHHAMQDVMILDQTADGGLKWVPLLSVERNGQMLTARFGDPFFPSSIDIAI